MLAPAPPIREARPLSADPHPLAWSVALPWAPARPQRPRVEGQVEGHHDVGVPLGGIGTGAISRGPNGGLTRWTLQAGRVVHASSPADGFALWQRPEGGPSTARALRPEGRGLPGWRFDPAGRHAALFPSAWHAYREGGLSLTIEQLSPVVPALMAEADLPLGLFRAHLRNAGPVPLDAGVMLSLANLVGRFTGAEIPPGGVAGQRSRAVEDDGLAGVLMTRDRAGPPDMGEGEVLIAARRAGGVEVTLCPAFDPLREGAALWRGFAEEGRVAPQGGDWVAGGGFSEFPAPGPVGAIAARVALAPGEARTLDLALVWDLPVIRFGQGRRWLRHHAARWGAEGRAARAIAAHALPRAGAWSEAIDRFHDAATARLDLPPEAAHLAINELYMLTDGLAVWTAPEGPRPERFGLIECPDYPLYATLDLWSYAAAAVSDLFAPLARLVLDAYAEEVPRDDPEPRLHLKSSARMPRQRAGMAPHDLGAPDADPFARANDYAYQDSTRWKDFNAMLAVTAWREARSGAPATAARWWPAVSEAMEALALFDRDGDGMIENDGVPDQTFDNVPMTGISAYCGGLWLTALRATAALAGRVGEPRAAARWRAMSATAEPAFERALWTGTHFRLDSAGRFSDAILAEQMHGPATARMLGLGDTVDPAKARTALATVFRRCFLEAGGGRGAVAIVSAAHSSALYAPEGEEGLQWDEVLVGFNYSLAAQLRAFGLEAECRALMTALARELGPERGLHFRTPAAIDPARPLIRAQMNLRPLGAWALALARDAERADGRPQPEEPR